jgi:uncharacterized membrane protein YedE/YeeE
MEPTLPWYIGGPLLGLMIPLLLILKEKQLGVSSSLRVVGSVITPRLNYFKYDRTKDYWQLWFVLGIIGVSLVVQQLNLYSIGDGKEVETVYSLSNWLVFLVGGVAVGFGARYAGGCTAGHCLMGNSLLATSSIISTVSFFVGGLIVTHLLIPLIF